MRCVCSRCARRLLSQRSMRAPVFEIAGIFRQAPRKWRSSGHFVQTARWTPSSLRHEAVIVDLSIHHNADVSVAQTPVIPQWSTFAAESKPFDKPLRGDVIWMDQCLDAMGLELVSAVAHDCLHRFPAKAILLVLWRNDVTQFKAPIARVSVVVVHHANALIIRLPADRPRKMIVGARGLAQPS